MGYRLALEIFPKAQSFLRLLLTIGNQTLSALNPIHPQDGNQGAQQSVAQRCRPIGPAPMTAVDRKAIAFLYRR
jgi:hypothetical protein